MNYYITIQSPFGVFNSLIATSTALKVVLCHKCYLHPHPLVYDEYMGNRGLAHGPYTAWTMYVEDLEVEE